MSNRYLIWTPAQVKGNRPFIATEGYICRFHGTWWKRNPGEQRALQPLYPGSNAARTWGKALAFSACLQHCEWTTARSPDRLIFGDRSQAERIGGKWRWYHRTPHCHCCHQRKRRRAPAPNLALQREIANIALSRLQLAWQIHKGKTLPRFFELLKKSAWGSGLSLSLRRDQQKDERKVPAHHFAPLQSRYLRRGSGDMKKQGWSTFRSITHTSCKGNLLLYGAATAAVNFLIVTWQQTMNIHFTRLNIEPGWKLSVHSGFRLCLDVFHFPTDSISILS